MFFIFWTSHGIRHTYPCLTLCNCLRNSARSNNCCVFQSNELRGERRVSRIPRPIIPRDLAKRVKFLANCGLIKPHYWTAATCQNTSLALETDQPDRPYHGPGIASLQMPQNT